MGRKERILELIKENDGLLYNTLIRKYNEKFGVNAFKEKSDYVFLKRLKKDGLIENDKGINVLYTPTPKTLNQESGHSDITLTDKVVEILVKSGVVSEDYGVEISEKEIMPSIKRLTESGKLG